MYVSIVRGDHIFKEWEEGAWEDFKDKVQELKENGYKKVSQEHTYLNYHEYYRIDGEEEITLTMMRL